MTKNEQTDLDRWIDGRTVTCSPRGTDRYRRVVAVCRVNGQDMAAWLVRRGYALDYRRYSGGAYALFEVEARFRGAGVWAGEFQWPWDWRSHKR